MTTLRRVILESKKNHKVHISTNYSSSEDSDNENEVSPRTRRKIELLEQQTKNIKPPVVESPVKKSKDYTICAVCEAGGLCNRSFHETCMEFRFGDDMEGLICFDCLRKKNMCNFCKSEGSIVQTRKKCLKKCTQCKDKFYCQNCIENEKSFESIFPVICPLHHCSQCGYPVKNKSNCLLQCVRCTNAYHSKCLPVNIQRINDIYIVCPIHLPTKSNTKTTTPKSTSSSKKSMSSIQIRENGVLSSEKHKKHKHSENNSSSSSSSCSSRYINDEDDEEEDKPLPLLHRNSLSTTPTPIPYNYSNKLEDKISPLWSSNIEIKNEDKDNDDDDDDDDYQYEDDEEEYEKKSSMKRKSESKSYSNSSDDDNSTKSLKRKKTSLSNTYTIKTPKLTTNTTPKVKTPKSKSLVTPNSNNSNRNIPKTTNTSVINQPSPKIELKLTSSKVITMIDSPLTIATQTERPLLSLSTSFTSLIYGTIIHPSNNKNIVDIKTETFMCNKILSFLENKPLNVNKLYVGLKNEGCTEEQLVMKAPNFETTGNYILSNPNLKFYCGPMKSIKPWKVTSS